MSWLSDVKKTDRHTYEIGDDITFKAATREHYRKATRKVRGYHSQGYKVSYFGWQDFFIKFSEVITNKN